MNAVWLDGSLRDRATARVAVDDRGLTLGDGVFETIRVYGGRPFRLGAHAARLASAVARLGIRLDAGPEQAVAATIEANRLVEGAVRVTVTRGAGAPGLEPPGDARSTMLVTAARYEAPAWWYERGLAAAVASGRLNEHGATAGLKTLNYLESIVALREARARGADDALRLDTAGHLAAGASSNVFVLRGGTLHTAPASCGILPGITRAVVRELAAEAGIGVVEAPLPPDALDGADEAFLTSSLRELVPVVQVDGRPVGRGRPGPATAQLLARYRQRARDGG